MRAERAMDAIAALDLVEEPTSWREIAVERALAALYLWCLELEAEVARLKEANR